MSKDKLEPCPLCGNIIIRVDKTLWDGARCYIDCGVCKLGLERSVDNENWEEKEQELISAWNRRLK